MPPPPRSPAARLADDVKDSWQRFLSLYEPLRPELYRYCRSLTRSPWDAEDLVQDTLARAFATLGCLFQEPPNPRAWLFRVASNLWVDRARRARLALPAQVTLAAPSPEPQLTREAAGTLLSLLSPQERAAVVLKDVFAFSLEETAEVLSTSVGAVKAALHRGRGKLEEPSEPAHLVAPAPGVLDAFCTAFNARDLSALTALLLDASQVELVGVVTHYGPEAAAHPETGALAGFFYPLSWDEERGGVEPRLLEGYRPEQPARAEVRRLYGEHLLLYWYAHQGGDVVRAVVRVEAEGERVAHVRNYFYAPDVLTEVCRELGVPFRQNGYRYWP